MLHIIIIIISCVLRNVHLVRLYLMGVTAVAGVMVSVATLTHLGGGGRSFGALWVAADSDAVGGAYGSYNERVAAHCRVLLEWGTHAWTGFRCAEIPPNDFAGDATPTGGPVAFSWFGDSHAGGAGILGYSPRLRHFDPGERCRSDAACTSAGSAARRPTNLSGYGPWATSCIGTSFTAARAEFIECSSNA